MMEHSCDNGNLMILKSRFKTSAIDVYSQSAPAGFALLLLEELGLMPYYESRRKRGGGNQESMWRMVLIGPKVSHASCGSGDALVA